MNIRVRVVACPILLSLLGGGGKGGKQIPRNDSFDEYPTDQGRTARQAKLLLYVQQQFKKVPG